MDVDNLEHKRHFEQSRYEALHTGKLRTKPNKPHYGVYNNGRHAWPQLEKFSIQSLVDIGTGNGAFPMQAVEKGIPHVAGVDFANLPDGEGVRWFKAAAHDLPFEDNEFGWLTSFDTLEHFIPEELDEILVEFRRVATTGWFFSISYRKSHTMLETDLHLIIRPKDWWKKKLAKYGEVEEFIEKYLWLKFR